MAFMREKRKGISVYYELVENSRDGKKVRQKVIKYFPNKKAMEEYGKKHNIALPEETPLFDSSTARKIESKLKNLISLRPLPEGTLRSLNEKFEVKMTYNSNAIEGNRLSLKETYLVLNKGMTINGKSFQEHLEATNHKDALNFIGKIIKKDKITEMDILELHAILLDKIYPMDAGFYRHEQVYISESEHVPPSWKEVPDLMKEVVKELNSKEEGILAVESAVKVHYNFVKIHPFIDGNGRMARLLCNLRLMRAGFPPVILERSIRKTYYDALERADAGDLKPLAQIIVRDVEKMLDLYISSTQ